jgi:hypothetical protein
MAAFLESKQIDGLPGYIYSNLARTLTRRDPVGALELSARLPGLASIEAGNEAFTTWRQSQPEAASEWLAQLPGDDPRRKTCFQNAIEDLAGDALKIELLVQFAAVDPDNAMHVVKNSHLPEERRNAALAIIQRK